MSLTRREFGKTIISSTLALGASLYLPPPFWAESGKSIVVTARSKRLLRTFHNVDFRNAVFFLNEAMCLLTNKTTPEEGWRSKFRPGEKVGIKLSCLPGKPLSSSIGVVQAVVEGLISAGVKAKDIYIWERTERELQKAGFVINKSGPVVMGTDTLRDGGYSNRIDISGGVGTCFSRIMEKVDALISVPVLKDHDIAGVSIGMKNFYGAIHNPNKFHGNRCDPYVADLCNFPIIKNKWRLTVCDASRVQLHNGPAFFPKYALDYGALLVGEDPVAVDYLGWQLIETLRQNANLKPLKTEDREPTYISTAAAMNLGVADMKKIQNIIL